MRIITGKARGMKLNVLDGDATRPTTEVVKEAVFSAIQFDLYDTNVLDLFGGSGQMALEALSRGAAKASIVDSSKQAIEIIKANATKTRLVSDCRIAVMDWKDFVKSVSGKEKFSLVFLDPPYKEGFLDEVLKKIFSADILTDNAIIVCESDENGVPEPIDGITSKIYRYGKTYVSVYRCG